MKAATRPIQRPPQARILVIDAAGTISHAARVDFPRLLRPGDLVVANDAATLPASLSGEHVPSGRGVEVRLAGRASLRPCDFKQFLAIVFGEGDYRIRTEHRPIPPVLAPGDRLALGSMRATVTSLVRAPRLVSLTFDGSPTEILEGVARHGRAIQYSHLAESLELWDIWTSIAGIPVAFEPPSAGFVLDWTMLKSMRARGIGFATLTHAAGISSTGDSELDARLPFDEPYRIPESTAAAIFETRQRGGRVIAIGTTVVRALEHSASLDGIVHSGENLATQTITHSSEMRVVDAILSGTHEPGTSHYNLLSAFSDADTLRRADEQLNAQDYRTHEFGDFVFLENARAAAREKRSAAA